MRGLHWTYKVWLSLEDGAEVCIRRAASGEPLGMSITELTGEHPPLALYVCPRCAARRATRVPPECPRCMVLMVSIGAA